MNPTTDNNENLQIKNGRRVFSISDGERRTVPTFNKQQDNLNYLADVANNNIAKQSKSAFLEIQTHIRKQAQSIINDFKYQGEENPPTHISIKPR